MNDDLTDPVAGRASTRGWSRRRALVAALGGGAAVPVLAACGGVPGAGTEAQPAPAERFDGKVVQHWGSYDGAGIAAWTRFYDQFVQAQAPGLRVDVQGVPNAEYLPKLTAAIVAGSPPDFCRFKENLNNDMAARQNALALDAYLAKDKSVRLADFTPSSVEALTYKDKPYGLPHYHQYVLLGWNKTLFKQVGLNPDKPPETWAELRDYAKRLTDPDKGQWGFKLYEYGPPVREQQFNWFME
jgi:ABC-type glycerol-3-phosphate transport system substrate-binding protein